MLKSIFYFLEMLEMKKNMTPNQIEDMHNIIRDRGFKKGFELYKSIYKHEKEIEKRRKDLLIQDYASNNFPKQPETTIKNFNPSIEQIKTFPIKTHMEKHGVSITLFRRQYGWIFILVEAPNLSTPRIFSVFSERASNEWSEAMKFYQELYRQLEPASEITNEQAINNRTNRTNNRQVRKTNNDVNIDHVRRAMGYGNDNQQNNNNENKDDDDLDFLKGLF